MSDGRSEAKAGPIVGIDLGTTNSLVAICDASGPRVLRDDDGRALVPSVVRYDSDRTSKIVATVVGREASERAEQEDDDYAREDVRSVVVSSVKRLIGRSLADARADVPYLPYRVVAGDRDTARVVVAMSDGSNASEAIRTVSPEEVSAKVLERLKAIAESRLGVEVRKVVITVPAHFDDAQRQATRTAGRLAGLEVVRIVPEPTAAALAYGIGLSRDAARNQREVSHVAVYDFGGGTFDVSILRLTPADSQTATDFYQVLATNGDTHLGGDDVDQLLVREFMERWIASHALPDEVAAASRLENRIAEGDAELVAGLMREARRVKHALAEQEVATFEMPKGDAVVAYSWTLTRGEFDALIEPIVLKTLAMCEQALRDARAKGLPEGALHEVLDAVILVGGSTRMPMVRERVRAFFGVEPYTAIDPDEAIALGASVQASILSGTTKGSLLLDVIPLSLGIETVGGAVAKLIVRNTAVPTRATEMFSTSVDNQTAIKLSVYQGEREMASDCRRLAQFELRGIPPMPAGLPQVQVQFLIDANGVLNVSAHERRSGKRAQMQIIPNHGLTPDEVNAIERDSLIHAREDMTRHRVVDLITNASLDLKWIGERLAKFEALLEPAYASELKLQIAQLADLVAKAKTDWRSVDANVFQRAKETLDRSSIRLQEVSITQSLKSQ